MTVRVGDLIQLSDLVPVCVVSFSSTTTSTTSSPTPLSLLALPSSRSTVMSRALVSPSPGDPEKPLASFFVPPPMQRLSRSLSSFPVPSSKSQCSFDRTSTPPSQGSSSALPGPNRAPSTTDASHPVPSSSKPSSIFPRLHRLEITDSMPSSHKKPPLLDLQLSSTSFLDAVATDSDSDKPLYAVETVGSSTTIWRSDPWDGTAKIADIRWPKDLPLKGKARDNTHTATVQMDGIQWREATNLLKYSGLGSSRKFYIPFHPHALKWKREGNGYVCTTATCKGPVAVLGSSTDTNASPRLKVFETLSSFHQSVPQLDHAGISLLLLDHLFVTALLLVTEPDDWMTLARNPTSLDGRPPPPDAPSFRTASASRASARQWRKIMYGEPMYPSLKTPAFDKAIAKGGEDADVLDISEPPQLSTSARQWRKIVYGEPLYPSLRPQSVDDFDLPPRPSTATSFSSESAYSPPTPTSAPSTGFYDVPSLFGDTDKTTPRNGIGARRISSPLALSSGTLSPMPSSECIPLSAFPISVPLGPRRELPSPPSSYQPPPSIQPWLHRSRSSPKLSLGAQSPMPCDQDDPTNPLVLTRISNVRQLPTPPHRESPIQSPQVHARPAEARRLSQPHQRSLPPTPASISRSPSTAEQNHAHSLSQVVVSQSQLISTATRPSTPGPSMATVQPDGAARNRRARHEKDPDEVIHWMRNITRAHRRRALDGEEDPVSCPCDSIYEAPPPAYNAIDFSTPPQARSPPQS